MQRSRRAFLQRRALEKINTGRTRLYKLSLSLVFICWGLVFLFSLWISRGHGYRDGSMVLPIGISTWNEGNLEHSMQMNSVDKCSRTQSVETRGSNDDLPLTEGNKSPLFDFEQLEENSGSISKFENNAPKSDRLSHALTFGFNEFKSRAFSSKGKSKAGESEGVIHRVEPGGKEYNYASSSKGAKVLAFNREAKGASSVLDRDNDKYLRNPCSVEEKFVIIELSEETLVDTIEITNFEHYSSNLKEFELLGSLVYPTSEWVNLGNFTAANVRHAQRFALQEPKWVRYLKLNFLSHYGAEFYCTLSVVEVYGVDAVERMLEDLISVQEKLLVSDEATDQAKPLSSHTPSQDNDNYQDLYTEMESEATTGSSDVKRLSLNSKLSDPIEENRQQVGRMPGDTVLKILMQKVRNLDLSLSVLEQYLEEVNSRYGNIFKEFDKDLGKKDIILEKMGYDIKNFHGSQEVIAKDVSDLISWKSHVSIQLDNLLRDNFALRSKVESVWQNQVSMENKGIAVFLVCSSFGFLAFTRLFVDMMLSVYRAFTVQITEKSREFCCVSSSWFLLLLSCSIILLILSL